MTRRGLNMVVSLTVALLTSVYLLWRAPGFDSLVANPDHGYQISLGYLALQGRFPSVDLIYVYGPLAAFTSAAGIWLSGNLVAEIVICALLYAAAITMLHWLTRDEVGFAAGLVVPVVALLLLARFYKWYVWFFPAAVLLLIRRSMHTGVNSLRWWSITGLTSGLGALYRFEFGIILVSCSAAIALMSGLRQGKSGQNLGMLFSGFFVPFGAWLIALVARGGFNAVISYFDVMICGAIGTASNWSIPPPRFIWADPLGSQSSHALALLLMPAVYLSCIAVGIDAWRSGAQSRQPPSPLFLVAAGLIGLGVLPHALYRADPAHLLQDIPPMLVATPALIRRTWITSRMSDTWRKTVGTVLCVALSAVILIMIRGVLSFGAKDLVPAASNPILKYRQLVSEELGEVPGIHAEIAREIESRTEVFDPILIVPYAPQLYYFSHRPMSGLLNIYFLGIHDETRWRERNLAATRTNPPKIVVSSMEFDEMSSKNKFRRSQPELYEFLRNRYRTVLFRAGNLVLLGPGNPDPPGNPN